MIGRLYIYILRQGELGRATEAGITWASYSAERPRIEHIKGGTHQAKGANFQPNLGSSFCFFENGTSLLGFLQVQNRQCFQSSFDQKTLQNQEPLSIASSIPQE